VSGRFFMRFNLHNSVGHFPVSVDIFERLLPYDRAELIEELEDFEAIQKARVERLKEKYALEIERLQHKKVVFLGDSISSDNLGYRSSVTRAAGLEAYDATISGGVSSMLLHDARMLAERQRPDVVSIMVGSNDSVMIDGLHHVGIAEYERNLRQMVSWARTYGAAVLLFEIPPVIESRFEKHFSPNRKSQSNQNIQSYNRVLQKIAKENQIAVISNRWLANQPELFEPDGIHLSVEGQELFAEKWLIAASELFS